MYNENFDELYEQFKKLIWSVIKDVNIQGYDKDDLLQEMLMVLNECNTSYDPDKNTKFSTYFYVSMKTQLHKLLRTQGRLKRAELVFLKDEELDVLLSEQSFEKDIEKSVKEEELYHAIINELVEMPYGKITYMILIDGLSMREVGEKLGVSKQRISKAHSKNIKKLKEKFSDYLVDKYE